MSDMKSDIPLEEASAVGNPHKAIGVPKNISFKISDCLLNKKIIFPIKNELEKWFLILKLFLELNSLTIRVVMVDARKINVIGNNDLKIRENIE